MKVRKPAAEDAAGDSALTPPPLFDYYPRWRWMLAVYSLTFLVKDLVEHVASRAWRHGHRAGRGEQLIVAVLGPEDMPPQPHCGATGTVGCLLAEEGRDRCPVDGPCFLSLPAHNAD